MLTEIKIHRYAPYHVSDTDEMLDDLKVQIEDDLNEDTDVVDFKFVKVDRLTQAWCDQRNEDDFEGDPVLSAKWDRAIVYEIERIKFGKN